MLIYAHRGASIDFLEGSKAAYLAAIEQGADGFECDVRLTKDKQIICYHDANTMRLSKINLKIASSTYQQLSEQIEVLRLDDLLALAIESKKDLVIESKHPVVTGGLIEKLTHKLLEKNAEAITESKIKISLISFSFFASIRNKKSGYQSAHLVENKFLARFSGTPVMGVSIKFLRANPDFIKKQQKKEKKVFVWTVNEQADLHLCADLGVDAIMSDKPGQVRKWLGYS